MRVSSNIEPNVLAGIQQSEMALQTALQQVSTGQRVSLPGDDPGASASLVRALTENNNIDQYTKNASAALGQVQTADSILTSVVSLLTQAVTLGTQGANGTNTATNRQVLATQVQGILSSVVSGANATYQGVAVFGGTVTTTKAFVADPSGNYNYQGDSSTNQVQVGDSFQVQVNIPGDKLFTNSTASVLGSLSQLANALKSGSSTDISDATTSVSSALNYLSAQHGVFGSSINQLTAQETFLSQEKVTLSAQATSLVGIDPAVAIENLAQAQTHNSAVLAAAAKVLPTTLLDYLK